MNLNLNKILSITLLSMLFYGCAEKKINKYNYYMAKNFNFYMKSDNNKLSYLHSALYLDEDTSKQFGIYKKGYRNYLIEYQDSISIYRYNIYLLAYDNIFDGKLAYNPSKIKKVSSKQYKKFRAKFHYLRNIYSHYLVIFKDNKKLDEDVTKVYFVKKLNEGLGVDVLINLYFLDNDDSTLILRFEDHNYHLNNYSLAFSVINHNGAVINKNIPILNKDISILNKKQLLKYSKKFIYSPKMYYKIRIKGKDLSNPNAYLIFKNNKNKRSYKVNIVRLMNRKNLTN